MLDLPDLDAYDSCVADSEGIDRWCSSSDWVLPLTASLRPVDPFVLRTSSGWGVFDRGTDVMGRSVVLGVDRIWGFACPVVGGQEAWHEVLSALAELEPDVVLLQGLVEGGAAWRQALTAGSAASFEMFRAGGIVRRHADLSGGFEAWFSRRSQRFRQRLRRIRRDAAATGLVVLEADERGDQLLDILISIEAESWKGAERDGLISDDMAGFYRLVLDRLGRERVRCLVAWLDGRRVGYIVGGVRDRTYRGLQLSYGRGVADLGVGHLLQLTQIEQLCAEGISTYDLGMDMEYKRRWADGVFATTTVAAVAK